MKFSLDNITIIGRYKDEKIISYLETLPLVKSFYQTPKQIYPYNFACHSGVFIQLGHNKTKDRRIRVEFNPNKLNRTYEKDLWTVLKFIHWAELSRRDIAVDIFDTDINDWNFLDRAGRKRITYTSGAGKLETVYLGSADSDERIRIYDKALEQGKDRIKDGIQWLRIEAQVRREKARTLAYNPFMKIRITKREGAYLEHDLRTRAMVEYLETHPEAWGELSKNSRSKYKKIMAENNEVEVLDVETEFYRQWEELKAQCDSWLNFTSKHEGTGGKPLESVLRLLPKNFPEGEREKMIKALEGLQLVEYEGKKNGKEEWEEFVKSNG